MRVVIGEDSVLFREGLGKLLVDAGHEVVGAAGNALEVVDVVEQTAPDLVVLDIRMPPDLTDDGARPRPGSGRCTRTSASCCSSQHVETRHSVGLVTTGRFGYLLKDRVLDVDDFLDTLDRVAAGGSALDPEVVVRLLGARQGPMGLERLTPREHEVLALMAEGRTNGGIARRLWLTDRTVETHVASIMAKLDLGQTDRDDNRRVLVVLAYLEAHAP